MICYLIRHGKDDDTVRGGWSRQSLTEEGITQAEALAYRIKSHAGAFSIKHVYASDLSRAMDTAKIIAAELALPVIPASQFREVNNGELAGMNNELALKGYPGMFWNQLSWEQCYPGGESPKVFYERICAAWEAFSREIIEKNENVMLVTHGGVIHVILSLVEWRGYSNKERQRNIPHASIVALSYESGVWKEVI